MPKATVSTRSKFAILMPDVQVDTMGGRLRQRGRKECRRHHVDEQSLRRDQTIVAQGDSVAELQIGRP